MKLHRLSPIFLLAVAALALSCSGEHPRFASNGPDAPVVEVPADPPAKEVELDVPFVPTPNVVVDAMLEMGKVNENDILYDLGSGDGRIPITAAKRFGTPGVGIDLDPKRVEEANRNAEKEAVTDKVRFIEGDIFKENFSEATVVTLYLLPEVNLKLKPKLLAMKPGTRIVSHNYHMGDWLAEESKTLTVDDQEHHVYFWRVPEGPGANKQQ